MRRYQFVAARSLLSMLLLASVLLAYGVSRAGDNKPLKVFMLVGQSNTQGHARITTFEHIGMNPVTAPLLADMPSK